MDGNDFVSEFFRGIRDSLSLCYEKNLNRKLVYNTWEHYVPVESEIKVSHFFFG